MTATASWEEVVLDGMITTRKAISAENEKALDENQDHIIKHIKDFRDKLSFETVFEAFTAFGLAPALVYDDNGMFAISDCGVSAFNKADGKTLCGYEMHGAVYEDENLWRPTVREALNAYIDTL